METVRNRKTRDLLIDSSGTLTEIEEEVDFTTLPEAVRRGLQSGAGNVKITKVEAVKNSREYPTKPERSAHQPCQGDSGLGSDGRQPDRHQVLQESNQYNIYEGTANSWYHGMMVELSKRFSQNVTVNLNYTLSKSTDETTDYNSDFQSYNQMCRSCERALSSFDQRHKFVAYALLRTMDAGKASGLGKALADLTLTPIFRYNSSRPFNLLAGAELNNDRHNTTDRPYLAGRNTGIGPSFWTFDARLGRRIRFSETMNLDLMAEAFNLFNKLNYGGVNNTVGNISGPFNLTGRDDRSPSDPLGFTSAADPRRVQLGLRFTFKASIVGSKSRTR